jgi:hypothetical protein
MRIEMPTFNWTIRFKGEFCNRVFKGEASTDQSVAIGEMMQAVGQTLWRTHGHPGVTKITASIHIAKKRNTKGEQKP